MKGPAMSAPEEILNQIPLDQLAADLGTDEATARQAALTAIPLLISGMGDNARDDAGAVSLVSALNNHASSGLTARGTLKLDDVDTADGDRIVGHVLGNRQDTVVRSLGGGLGLDNPTTQRLLKILAPIVMAYLAKKVLGGEGGGMLGGPQQAGGGTLAAILEQLLGGGRQTQPQTRDEAGGGLLGGLLKSLGLG